MVFLKQQTVGLQQGYKGFEQVQTNHYVDVDVSLPAPVEEIRNGKLWGERPGRVLTQSSSNHNESLRISSLKINAKKISFFDGKASQPMI